MRATGTRPYRAYALILALSCLFSCASAPEPAAGSALKTMPKASAGQAESAEVERLIVLASPSSLREALSLLDASSALADERKRYYRYVTAQIALILYPEMASGATEAPSPAGSPVVRLYLEARAGRIAQPALGAGALEELACLLAVIGGDSPENGSRGFELATRFERSGAISVVVPYLRGLVEERRGNADKAYDHYSEALALASDCYPARMGLAKSLVALGHPAEALPALDELESLLPKDRRVVALKAEALYESGSFAEAAPYLQSALRDDPLNADFVLARAHVLVAASEFRQASSLLDAYSLVEPDALLYLILRARVASEGFKNREEALRYGRKAMDLYPEDLEASLIVARLLSQGNASQKEESRIIAERVMQTDPSSAEARSLLFEDAAARRDWETAAFFLDSIEATSPGRADRRLAFDTYRRAKRLPEALAFAEGWYREYPQSEEAYTSYCLALALSGQKEAFTAGLALASSLAAPLSSKAKSRLAYAKSIFAATEDEALSLLREALVEDMRNIDALGAICLLYLKKKDVEKARFYLRQALVIDPLDPELLARKAEMDTPSPIPSGPQSNGSVTTTISPTAIRSTRP